MSNATHATWYASFARRTLAEAGVRLAMEGAMLAVASPRKRKDGGRWITIGAKTGEDGEKHGGSPVYVVDGRITKGHPSLTGKKVADVGREPAKPDRHGKLKSKIVRHLAAGRDTDLEGLHHATAEHPAEDVNDALDELAQSGHVNVHERRFGGPRLYPTGKEYAEPEADAYDLTHRQQLNQSKEYARAVHAKKARKAGIDPSSLHQLAGEFLQHDRAFKADVRKLLDDARDSAGHYGQKLGGQKFVRSLAEGTFDADSVPHFDEIADSMAHEHANLFIGHEDDPGERLAELLTAGNPEPMGEEDAYDQAFEALAQHLPAKKLKRELEEAPFSVAFDESKHERGQPENAGQFGKGGGGAKTTDSGGAAAADKPGAAPGVAAAPEGPHAAALADGAAKHRGILARYGDRLNKAVDAVPVVGWVKQKMTAAMASIHDVAVKRYGPKTAKMIMASGTVADLALMGGGVALTGVPIFTGVNHLVGIIPAFVLAEGKYWATGGSKFAVDDSLLLSIGPHKYSSTQFNVAGPLVSRFREMAARIPDEDLAEDGREDEPHITIKYGLHTDDPDEVVEAAGDFGPVQIRLGKTFIFPGKEHDVVNVEVVSRDIHRLNKRLAKSLEHTDTHPDYVPHVCLAYVKPGEGEKYAGWDDVEGYTLDFTELVFSPKDGERTTIAIAKDAAELAVLRAKVESLESAQSATTPPPAPASTRTDELLAAVLAMLSRERGPTVKTVEKVAGGWRIEESTKE